MKRRGFRLVATLSFMLAFAPAARADFTLYDGSKGTTPDAQGWVYLTNPPFGASATQTASGGVTILDTTAKMSESAGDFGTGGLVGTLDPTAGFTVNLRVQLNSESHASNDRAGFSLIALGSDGKGLELGFWQDQVWAQNDSPVFTHGESAAYDTTAGLVTYALSVKNGAYTLSANGVSILAGLTRDYSAFGAPYTSKNFLFFGDDTSSASARTRIASLTLSAVPEPSAGVQVGLGVFLVAAFLVRRSRALPE